MAEKQSSNSLISSLEHALLQAALDVFQQQIRRQINAEKNPAVRVIRQGDLDTVAALRDKVRSIV